MESILIVEDNVKSRYMLEQLLTDLHYTVYSAGNGKDALFLLSKNHIDLIISDILMPKMNGFLFCHKVKKNKRFKNIPFIFYTATFVSDNDKKLAFSLGASRFVIKPAETDVFINIIKEVLLEYKNGNLQPPDKSIADENSIKELYDYSITCKLDKKVQDLYEEQLSLKRSQQTLKEAQEIAHVGHWELDIQSKKMYWSDEMYRIIGCKPQGVEPGYEEFLNRVYPEDRENIRNLFQNLLINKIPFDRIHRISLKENNIRYVHQRGQIQYDDDGNPVYLIGTVHDITEAIIAEKEKKRAAINRIENDKLIALGTLSAGIVHELNNPLTGIYTFVGYCKEKTRGDNDLHCIIVDMEKEVQRCINIVKNLLNFSYTDSRGIISFAMIDLHIIIDRILRLLAYRLKDVTIIKQLDSDCPEVMIQADKIQQVFLNILINAIDAMEGCGVKEIRINTCKKNENVEITFRDTGKGIQPGDIGRIFDPFFTTKKIGKGIGLGLSLCRQIIKEHKGEISCESETRKGALFRIILPVNRE